MASFSFRAAIVVTVLVAAAGAAQAQNPGPVQNFNAAVIYDAGGYAVDNQTHFNVASPNGSASASALNSTAGGVVSSQPGSEPSVSGSGTAAAGTTVFGGASLQYEFEITGPNGQQDPIQAMLTGLYNVKAGIPASLALGDNSTAGIQLSVCPTACFVAGNTSLGDVTANAGSNFADAGDNLLHPYQLSLSLLSNTIYQIYIGANVSVFNTHGSSAVTANAFLDPHISFTLTDSNANASLYGLQLSTGISAGPAPSPSAAPEPAIWATMLLGFGGLGAMLRRQRRQGRAALARGEIHSPTSDRGRRSKPVHSVPSSV